MKSNSNFSKVQEPVAKAQDTDLFMTKIGIDDYAFADELLNTEALDEEFDPADEEEALKQQRLMSQLNEHSKKM